MTQGEAELAVLGREVPVGSIEEELKRLWEADEASTNASLMNLAVYSEDPDSLVRNSEATQALTREHACRAILIGMDRKAPEVEVKAWVTAHCHLAHGQKSMCCEQLSFLLRGKAMGRLRNTIFAHLASDLPLVFWWQGELSSLFEPALYRRIDRFVFDSTEWRDLRGGFGMIRAAAEDAEHRLVLQDLAWTRSHHFRIALAGLFDDLVAQRALPAVHEVRIVAHAAQRSSALLLLAWLATQAGWRLEMELGIAAERAAGCGECFMLESAGGTSITARVEWDEDGAPLSRLEVKARDCAAEVTRAKGSAHLHQRLACPGHEVVSSGPAGADSAVALVADQLSRGGKNALFRKVWPIYMELLAVE